MIYDNMAIYITVHGTFLSFLYFNPGCAVSMDVRDFLLQSKMSPKSTSIQKLLEVQNI